MHRSSKAVAGNDDTVHREREREREDDSGRRGGISTPRPPTQRGRGADEDEDETRRDDGGVPAGGWVEWVAGENWGLRPSDLGRREGGREEGRQIGRAHV